MVRKKDGIKAGKDLDGAAVCVQQGTTTEKNISDFFRKNGMKMKAVLFTFLLMVFTTLKNFLKHIQVTWYFITVNLM